MKIRSWHAFLIYSSLITAGYVLATFKDAPFLAYASQITIGFAAYIGKRLWQKRFNNDMEMHED
jgi:hypothetical protein